MLLCARLRMSFLFLCLATAPSPPLLLFPHYFLRPSISILAARRIQVRVRIPPVALPPRPPRPRHRGGLLDQAPPPRLLYIVFPYARVRVEGDHPSSRLVASPELSPIVSLLSSQ